MSESLLPLRDKIASIIHDELGDYPNDADDRRAADRIVALLAPTGCSKCDADGVCSIAYCAKHDPRSAEQSEDSICDRCGVDFKRAVVLAGHKKHWPNCIEDLAKARLDIEAERRETEQAFDTPRLCDLCGKEQAKDADAYCKGHGEPAVCRITVNMVQHDVEGNAISYEQVAALAGKPGATHLTMTYSRRGDGGGSLIPGERVELFDDMHFCAVNTGNA